MAPHRGLRPRPGGRWRRWPRPPIMAPVVTRALLLVAGLAAWTACGPDLEAAFTQLMDARRLAADMRVQLHRSVGAAQRAVMAESDDAAADFAREAEEATRALEQDLESIEPMLERLRYTTSWSWRGSSRRASPSCGSWTDRSSRSQSRTAT